VKGGKGKALIDKSFRKDYHPSSIDDGLVKSPSAALRCNFVVAAHP
jgi:hypothetical protein